VPFALFNELKQRATKAPIFSSFHQVGPAGLFGGGELLPPLTPELLRRPHRSIARNHRICEALFLARYIEKFGTGTLMMIKETAAHGLPEPQFEQIRTKPRRG